MNKRKKQKFPNLDKSYNLKIRHESIDYDYLDKLTDDEKRWLDNFTSEWISADFNHKGKKLNKTKKAKKAIYDANNARNRDSFSITKSNGMLTSLTRTKRDEDNFTYSQKEVGANGYRSTDPREVENTLNAVIDNFEETKPKK